MCSNNLNGIYNKKNSGNCVMYSYFVSFLCTRSSCKIEVLYIIEYRPALCFVLLCFTLLVTNESLDHNGCTSCDHIHHLW